MEWWVITKTEKGAVIAIVIIAVISLVLTYFIDFIPIHNDFSKLHVAANILDSLQGVDNDRLNSLEKKGVSYKFNGSTLNVNELSHEDWRLIIEDTVVVNRLLNYKSAIGGFDNLLQLKKVYGIDTNFLNDLNLKGLLLFDRIDSTHLNRATITSSQGSKKIQNKPTYHGSKSFEELEKTVVELNSATTESIQKISGIGYVFSKRILKYKELLGGFVAKQQLKEVYGIDSLKYIQIESQIIVDTQHVIKLNINTSSIETLSAHPYISFKMARLICNYRTQHGEFRSVTDLKNIYGISATELNKAMPYFTVSNKF
ncbi:MAG: helix-hairpin-helix domain-containing protein [Bacteroidetes bacterium]|nr:helix-hairpin-helix domain-containing protein [Bacteroidota bacterium]